MPQIIAPNADELRKHLIVWAQNQATGQGTSAAISNRKYITDKHIAKREAYEFMVHYLRSLEIVEGENLELKAAKARIDELEEALDNAHYDNLERSERCDD